MAAGSRVSGRVIALVVFALGFAAACAELLGDVQVDGNRTEDTCPTSVADGLGTATCPAKGLLPQRPVICEDGATQCDGRLLQACADQGRAWVTVEPCATPALCEASDIATVAACIPPKCAEEQMSCDAAGVLRLCNTDRTGWEPFDTCKTAAHCDAGKRQCLPAPCNPGDLRCNVGSLERCRQDQLDWELLDACSTNEVCEATLVGRFPGAAQGGVEGQPALPLTPPANPAEAAEPPTECLAAACARKEVICQGVRLEACNEGQTGFVLAETCATPALCEASITYTGLRGSPRCVRPTCFPGEHHCSEEGVLELCNDNQDGFRPIEECIGPQFCSAVAADNGQLGCREAPCEAGEEQCNGAQIQRCRDDRTDFDAVGEACETRGLCNDDDRFDAQCEAPVCQRGALSGTEFRCVGATLQRCNDQHTGYDTLDTCDTAGLCNAGLTFNGCVTPTCAPGQTQCSGDFLQVCNANRTGFDNLERCAAGTCDSNAGRCADPCVVGSARCNSQGQLEECRNRLIGREITARCASPQLCDAQNRVCLQPPPGCTADGVRQCVSQGAAGTALQVCTEGRRRFATLATCTGAQVCDVNNTTCDVCNQNSQPTCQGDTLVTCAADGQSQRALVCPQGCQVVTNGPDRCRNCVVGAATCEGSQLSVCVARGANDEFLERRACDSAGICQNTLASCNSGRNGAECRCVPGTCAPGDRDCNGAQPTTCNADRTAMVASGPSCLAAVNCNPAPVGACFPCAVGDVQCGADSVLEGCRSDRSGYADLPGARPRDVRCISSNGGVFSQSCNGSSLVQTRCESGLCSADGGGCAQCDPDNFDSECTTTSDGRPARTECVGGRDDGPPRACESPSNPCSVATCADGDCNTTGTRPRGTECPRGAGRGFCDGARSPSCVECIDDGQCDNDDNDCTTDTCNANGSCQHSPTSGGRCEQADGAAGVCATGVCVRCGDGIVNGNEVCDGRTNATCPAGTQGTVTCSDACTLNTSGCVGIPRCGNDVQEAGEQCDGRTNANCPAGTQGTVTCSNTCTLNTSACTPIPECGNDVLEAGEQCDGSTKANCPAGTQGTVRCNDNCTLNTNGCTAIPECGNNVLETGEQCDTDDVQGCGAGQVGSITCVNCRTVNACQAAPPPARCGDGIINGTDQCDTTAVQDCPGNQVGSITCVNCRTVNTCQAAPPAARCGDGIINGNDQCDTSAVEDCGAGQVGSITCANCRIVNTCQAAPPAARCGDGIINGTDQCDTNDVQDCGAGQVGSISCQNCRIVNTCQAAPPPQPVCGNGEVEQGEGCDFNGQQDCPNGQIGSVSCVSCQIQSTCQDPEEDGDGNQGNGNGNGNQGNGNGNGNQGNGNGNQD